MSNKILKQYIRELLNEYDIDGNNSIKAAGGDLPPIDIEEQEPHREDDNTYQNLMFEYAWRIYCNIHYYTSDSEVKDKLVLARYCGDALVLAKSVYEKFQEQKAKKVKEINDIIDEYRRTEAELERKMNASISAGKGAVGKRKLALLRDEIKKQQIVVKEYENIGGRWFKEDGRIDNMFRITKTPQIVPGYPKSLSWVHTDHGSRPSIKYRDEVLRSRVMMSSKPLNSNKIANDILTILKNEKIQNEFRIEVRKSKAEQELYDRWSRENGGWTGD
jgi:hypothetical protein